MGFDPARVVEVYLRDPAGRERVGSGYLVSDRVALTAGHMVPGSPTDGRAAPERWRCEIRPLGQIGWLPARLGWRDESRDLGLLRLDGGCPLPPESPAPRWGRLSGSDPVACMAVGFPWAQARRDLLRDSEQLFGHVAPLTGRIGGRSHARHPLTRQSQRPCTGICRPCLRYSQACALGVRPHAIR